VEKWKKVVNWLAVAILAIGGFFAIIFGSRRNDSGGLAGMGRNLKRGRAAQRERQVIERERESGLDNREEAIRSRQDRLSEREEIERDRADLAKRKRSLLERIKNRSKK
jgi:hypothetical protein